MLSFSEIAMRFNLHDLRKDDLLIWAFWGYITSKYEDCNQTSVSIKLKNNDMETTIYNSFYNQPM